MKRILFITLITAFVTGLFTSCENADWEFPDYEFSAVYFAYQSPIRTITLGEDVFETTLDNEYQAQIMATMGGVYANRTDVVIGIEVDNSLVDGLAFDESNVDPLRDIIAMPTNYYSLSSDRITIEKGKILGGVTVQLTDAFFADPLALTTHYVIPVVMTSVSNADSILSGIPLVENPRRGVAEDWEVQPKDYILYAIKYINPWDANYLRRGEDVITKDGVVEPVNVRRQEFVEKDQVVKLTTIDLNSVRFPMDYVSSFGHNLGINLRLDFNFNEENEFLVFPYQTDYQVNDSVRVFNIESAGSGKFLVKGEKNSWGNKDRDALYLNYDVSYQVEVTFPNTIPARDPETQVVSYETEDILVVRDRAVKPEWFTATLK